MKVLEKAVASAVFVVLILSIIVPSVTFAESESGVIDIDLNKDKAIENRLKRGSVEGFKRDDKGKSLKGALFGLFREEETNFKKENALLTDISDENGFFGFYDLPFGKYKIYEISPPEGYQTDGKLYEAVIDNDSDVVNIFSCNHPVAIAETGDENFLKAWSAAVICSLLAVVLIFIGNYRKKQQGEKLGR